MPNYRSNGHTNLYYPCIVIRKKGMGGGGDSAMDQVAFNTLKMMAKT